MRAEEHEADVRRRGVGTSGQMMAKSSIHRNARRRSGGCASKAVELTSGDLQGVVESRLRRSRGRLSAMQKSAEGVVAGEQLVKARTCETSGDREAGWRRAEARHPDGARPIRATGAD